MFNNYDPGRVIVVFGEYMLTGFADGTMINIEHTADAFVMKPGAAGDITRVRNRDKSATITLTLMAASPSNDDLSVLAREDEIAGTGYRPVLIKDLNGNTVASAAQAWIKKKPSTEFGTDASNREWTLDAAKLELHVGGAVV